MESVITLEGEGRALSDRQGHSSEKQGGHEEVISGEGSRRQEASQFLGQNPNLCKEPKGVLCH